MPLNPSIGNVVRALLFPVSPTMPQFGATQRYPDYVGAPRVQQIMTTPVSHDTAYVGPSRLGPDSLTTQQVRG